MIATLILPMLLSGLQQPTYLKFDDAVKDFTSHAKRGLSNDAETLALERRVAGEIDFETLDREQVYKLCTYGFSRLDDVRPKILARLDALPAPDKVEKARIAYTKAFAEYSTPDAGAALKAALDEPATVDLIEFSRLPDGLLCVVLLDSGG